MYEIGVIEFKKSSKFNKNLTEEEITLKVSKLLIITLDPKKQVNRWH